MSTYQNCLLYANIPKLSPIFQHTKIVSYMSTYQNCLPYVNIPKLFPLCQYTKIVPYMSTYHLFHPLSTYQNCFPYFNLLYHLGPVRSQLIDSAQKKNNNRSKGKGRRCCLGDRIYSMPCHAICCALGQFEEQDELHQDDLKKKNYSSYSSKSPQYKIPSAARS